MATRHLVDPDGVSIYAAPSRERDLGGLTPTFISSGALGLLVDEDMDYSGRLMRAGVPTELHVYPGCIHGFRLGSDRTSISAPLRVFFQPFVAHLVLARQKRPTAPFPRPKAGHNELEAIRSDGIGSDGKRKPGGP